MRRGRRLAIDVGDARIGVASCDPDGILATPVETVPGRDVPAAHRRLGQIVEEYEPIEVIIGLPGPWAAGRVPPRPRSVRSPRCSPARCTRCRCGWWTSG